MACRDWYGAGGSKQVTYRVVAAACARPSAQTSHAPHGHGHLGGFSVRAVQQRPLCALLQLAETLGTLVAPIKRPSSPRCAVQHCVSLPVGRVLRICGAHSPPQVCCSRLCGANYDNLWHSQRIRAISFVREARYAVHRVELQLSFRGGLQQRRRY